MNARLGFLIIVVTVMYVVVVFVVSAVQLKCCKKYNLL